MRNSKTPKVILISGIGLGKTYISQLIQKDYQSRGTQYKREVLGEGVFKRLQELQQNPVRECVIIETNCFIKQEDISEAWQHIVLS